MEYDWSSCEWMQAWWHPWRQEGVVWNMIGIVASGRRLGGIHGGRTAPDSQHDLGGLQGPIGPHISQHYLWLSTCIGPLTLIK
jgi:hypothetical protein